MTGRRAVPGVALVPAVIAAAFLALPLLGLLVRVPWSRVGEVLASEVVRSSLALSLSTSLVATGLSIVLGLPLAWLLALVRAVVTLPLVLPPVVGGLALLGALGPDGLVGAALRERLGVTVVSTSVAVVLAQTFVSMPFFVLSVEGALRGMDRRLDEAAASLGASRWTTMRRVTLPLLAPSIAAGAVLAWARAIGEFGATVTFAGSLPGRTQTLPLAIYAALESDPQVASVLGLVLLGVCLTLLLALRGRWLGQVAR